MDMVASGSFVGAVAGRVADFAVASLLAYAALHAARVAPRCPSAQQRECWGVLSVGLLYLAADELFGIHEGVARLLVYVDAPAPPPFTRLNDNVIEAAIAVAGGLVLLRYASVLIAMTAAPGRIFALAFTVSALAFSLDVALHDNAWREECTEVLAAGGFALAARTLAASVLGSPSVQPAGVSAGAIGAMSRFRVATERRALQE